MSYDGYPVDDQFRMISSELQHIGRLEEAARMWDEAREWIDDKIANFQGELHDLQSSRGWDDDAGKAFVAHAEADLDSLRSWTQATGEVPGAPVPVFDFDNGVTLNVTTKYTAGTTRSGVAEAMRGLAADIQTTYNNVKLLHDDLHSRYDLDPELKGENEPIYRRKIADQLTTLASQYTIVRSVLPNAIGAPWTGPRAAPSTSSDSPSSSGDGTGSAGSDTGETPGAPAATGDPRQDVGTEQNPDDRQNPGDQQDSTASLLDAGSSLLDSGTTALDSASQLLQQLGGSGTSSLPGTGDLSTLPGFADSLGLSDNPSGLPSLAGLDGGAAGTGSGVSPLTTATPATVSGTAGLGTSLPGTQATGGAAGTTAAGPGMMPAMYPPQAGGGSSSSGIRPGAAEQVNTSRARKPNGTPGVSLSGRTKGGVTPPAARRRWDTDTVELLDEELWQVHPTDNEPKYRAGH